MTDLRHAVFTVDDEIKLDGLGVGAPPGTRTLTAGAGLTGGGDLSADRTFDIVATDGTITVAANSIGVGTVPAGQVSGLAAIATTGSAANLASGTIPDARMPDLTGDVTTSEGSVATTIAPGAVSYAKIQDVAAASRILGRGSLGGAGDVEELTIGTGLALVGTVLTGLGGGAPTGTGFRHVTAGVEDAAAKLVDTADVNADQITNALLANMATARLKGRVTGGTGDPEDLTGTQATTLLDLFTDALKGLVPASGGGTTNFLRADGTFAAPPAGSGAYVLGTATLAFGATPTDEATVEATTSGLTATDHIDAFVMADDSTAANDTTAHRFLALSGRFSCEYVSATSLRIRCDVTMGLATGDFTVHWRHAA